MPDQVETIPPGPTSAHRAGPWLRRPDELATRPAWARKWYLLRVESGLSLQALADATGIDLTALSRYETGNRRPGPINERRILDAPSFEPERPQTNGR